MEPFVVRPDSQLPVAGKVERHTLAHRARVSARLGRLGGRMLRDPPTIDVPCRTRISLCTWRAVRRLVNDAHSNHTT